MKKTGTTDSALLNYNIAGKKQQSISDKKRNPSCQMAGGLVMVIIHKSPKLQQNLNHPTHHNNTWEEGGIEELWKRDK